MFLPVAIGQSPSMAKHYIKGFVVSTTYLGFVHIAVVPALTAASGDASARAAVTRSLVCGHRQWSAGRRRVPIARGPRASGDEAPPSSRGLVLRGARRRSDNPPPNGPRKPVAPPGAPFRFPAKRKQGQRRARRLKSPPAGGALAVPATHVNADKEIAANHAYMRRLMFWK